MLLSNFRMTTPFFRALPLALLFLVGTQAAMAAPNIISENLTGSGSFTPGSIITFSANTTNVGTDMTTQNSYKFRKVSGSAAANYYDQVRKDNYLYVGTYGGAEIRIFDISYEASPNLVASYTLPNQVAFPNGYISQLEISGNYLYVGGNRVTGYLQLAVLNISNPTIPSLATTVDTMLYSFGADNSSNCGNNDIKGMKIDNNRLYIVGGNGSAETFCIYDISNPASPSFLSDLQIPGFTSTLDVAGNFAYLAVGSDGNSTFEGVITVNISNATNPVIANQLAATGVGQASAVNNVKVNGSTLFLGGYGALGGLRIYSISNPASPQFITSMASMPQSYGLSINLPYLYLGNASGFNVIDVSNTAAPIHKQTVVVSNWHYSSDFTTNVVYTAGLNGLQTFKPYLRARFCIDNPNCGTSGASIKIATMNPLIANASVATSTTWVATLGAHTITYCSDYNDASNNNFDGVSESNETDNCSSYTFTVSNPVPPTVTFDAQVNGGAWSTSDIGVNPSDSINVRWSSTNATACTGTGFNTSNTTSGIVGVTTPAPNTSTAFGISCAGSVSVSDTLTVTTRQLPNFSQPAIFYTLSAGFSSTTGAYDSLLVTFNTTNTGGSNTTVAANYQVQFDNGRNGYEPPPYSGSLGQVAAGDTVTRNETIPGPIFMGNNRIRVFVDSSSAVTEVNEADNERVRDIVVSPQNPGLSITADRTLVQNGQIANIQWSTAIQYPTLLCQVSGPGVNLSPSATSGNADTQAIRAKSEYIFKCTETVTGTVWNDSVMIESQGKLEEV